MHIMNLVKQFFDEESIIYYTRDYRTSISIGREGKLSGQSNTYIIDLIDPEEFISNGGFFDGDPQDGLLMIYNSSNQPNLVAQFDIYKPNFLQDLKSYINKQTWRYSI